MGISLEEYFSSLDPKTLPRIIQVLSGIYFQGSIYEMYGNECCIPTGEVIKIIGIKISSIIAEACEQNEQGQHTTKIHLSLDYPGLFTINADKAPYHTVEEIIKSFPIGPHRLGHPQFEVLSDLMLDNFSIKSGEAITFKSVEDIDGEQFVNCEVVRDKSPHSFILPLSIQGDFFECEDDQFYTVKEILEWKTPKGRMRELTLAKVLSNTNLDCNPFPENFKGSLTLTPIYVIQAVMKFRKDIVQIPLNLDVEVIDVTDQYDITSFVQCISLQDLIQRPIAQMPTVAEIIEGSDSSQTAYSFLKRGKQIIIHSGYQGKRILASEIRSDLHKRHFLIPFSYQGKFKRRPREFLTAYDLDIAKSKGEQLHAVATKSFTAPHSELSTVFVGDQFLVQEEQQPEISEVTYQGTKKKMTVLPCEQIVADGYKKALLPVYMEGGFVEIIHDKKQYYLSEIQGKFQLPFNVKVSVRDLSVEEDILAGLPGLRLEEEITESYVLVSFVNNATEYWEIPVNRVTLSLQLLNQQPVQCMAPSVHTVIEEISEDAYYMLRRYENSALYPPPRPPKRPPPPPPKPNNLLLSDKKKLDPPKSPKVRHY
ncbi:protein THEMIS [Protopterus annectens]|uniref:protein THEMIS n=1 Tax=Protopterus annectens TaxID=7888 RepID=UPI001CFA155E|nr:protein THEMIS [Protopterus annectens]